MQGFKVLNVKFSNESVAAHSLFVKANNVREKVPQKPPNKTLFVIGIPPYCNEDSVKKLFSLFGPVKAVYLHKAPSAQIPPKEDSAFFPKLEPIKGFKIGYVVFQKESSLEEALTCDETLILPSDLILTGIQKWYKEYNERFVDKKKLGNEIKTYMDKFDEETNLKIQKEKELAEPQEDGWVTVTRKGRNPGFARKESVAKNLRRRSEKQQRKKELTNFYTFQIKESKMKNLVALRKKFEEDKRKIAALKEARRFKPF